VTAVSTDRRPAAQLPAEQVPGEAVAELLASIANLFALAPKRGRRRHLAERSLWLTGVLARLTHDLTAEEIRTATEVIYDLDERPGKQWRSDAPSLQGGRSAC
jgi:hypothetical protein